ncbi:MAG: hypothetical protein QM760_23155 [Nibricoccus sp.]
MSLEIRPAQALALGEQRDGLEHIGLAGAVLPGQHHHAGIHGEIEPRIGPERGEDQAGDAGRDHFWSADITATCRHVAMSALPLNLTHRFQDADKMSALRAYTRIGIRT